MFFFKKDASENKGSDEEDIVSPTKQELLSKRSLTEDVLNLVLKVMVLVGIFWFLFTFVFGLHRITENGMSPNIKVEDLIMSYRLDKNYDVLDPVAIKINGKIQVGRVMAKAGDTVVVNKQGLIVNGSLQKGLEDDFVKGKTLPYKDGITYPLTLKKGELFVLGDNREEARDSRLFGPIKEKETIGSLMWVLRRKNL